MFGFQLVLPEECYKSLTNMLSRWRSINYKKVALYSTGITYVGLLTYLTHKKMKLNHEDNWCNLMDSMPMSELVNIPEKILYESIKQRMELRYETPDTALLMNMPHFFKETHQEKETLRAFIRISTTLKSLYINELFFVSIDDIQHAKEKLKRLDYLRTIVSKTLEPKNIVNRLSLMETCGKKFRSICRSSANGLQTYQTWLRRVLGRRH
jgi:hypothetical protein